jgi:GDP-D-mannose 3', 5'-epimerase
LVTGAGGFIGHHLTRYLVDKGYSVRGVDVKPPEYEPSPADDFRILDLRRWENCLEATSDMTTSTTWPPTWAGSGSSRPTRP